MKIKLLIVILFVVSISLPAFGQSTEGREFWLGFMENYEDTVSLRELSVFISAAKATKGKIYIPYLNSEAEFTVAKDSVYKLILPYEKMMHKGSGKVTNKSVHIVSEGDINVFALNYKKQTADAALIYPVQALGNEYMSVTYLSHSDQPSEILVIATEDATRVEFDNMAQTVNFNNDDTVVELNKGETYQLQFTSDHTGTVIKSNKPVAVFSGSECTYVPSSYGACDHLFEQLPPISSLGREYGIVPLKTRKADTYKFVAVYDGTKLYSNGNLFTTLDRQQYFETMLFEPEIITASMPVLAAQFSNGQNYDSTNSDPFMIILSPLEQRRNNITFNAFTSSIIDRYYMNLILNAKDINKVWFDTAATNPSVFRVFPGDPKYVWAQIDISQGDHTLKSGGDGFIASVYGYGNFESYGYSAGARVEKLSIMKMRYGLFLDFALLDVPAGFINFDGIPQSYRNKFEIVDEYRFRNATGFNTSIGALFEIPSLLTTPFGVGVRGKLSWYNLNFNKKEYAFQWTALERTLDNNAGYDIFSVSIFPYLIFTPFEDFNLFIGPSWEYTFASSSLYTEKITSSINAHEINDEVYRKEDIANVTRNLFNGIVGIGYDFVMNENKDFRISPELFYIYSFTSLFTGMEFNPGRLSFCLSFKWGY